MRGRRTVAGCVCLGHRVAWKWASESTHRVLAGCNALSALSALICSPTECPPALGFIRPIIPPSLYVVSRWQVCGQLGMPSAHSQFMAFFSAYITLVTVTRHRFEDKRWKLLQLILPWALTAVTMASRVYLGYHSVPQVGLPALRWASSSHVGFGASSWVHERHGSPADAGSDECIG